jgi:hypothetical protein
LSDSRAPRPLDDGSAAGGNAAASKPLVAADGGNAAGAKPPATAAQPAAGNDPASRVTDIGDLPTAL